jgi:hypothetical protein
MGAYRCSNCNINYRTGYGFKCPACSSDLWWSKDDTPDVEAATEKVAAESVGHADNGLIPNVDQDTTEHDGRLWFQHQHLIDAGYLNLREFDVVRIRNRFYELQARIARHLTTGIRGGAWWIEEVIPEQEIEALFDGSVPFFVLGPEPDAPA